MPMSDECTAASQLHMRDCLATLRNQHCTVYNVSITTCSCVSLCKQQSYIYMIRAHDGSREHGCLNLHNLYIHTKL